MCRVGCETVWTKQIHRRYRLQHFTKQYNSSSSLCAATCRMQSNCSLYEFTESDDNVTCTLAGNYDETSYDVVRHVTSFTRKEHTCRLTGMPSARISVKYVYMSHSGPVGRI